MNRNSKVRLLTKVISSRWTMSIFAGILMFFAAHLGIWLETRVTVKTAFFWAMVPYIPYVWAVIVAVVVFYWEKYW